jgi:hypothetical protein
MRFLKNNSLSLVFLGLFLFSIAGQVFTGLKEYNSEMKDLGAVEVGVKEYLISGHFFQATFENWESEFLQMGLFVVFTVFLFQKGSSESKDPNQTEPQDNKPDPGKKGAPWPVKTGGWVLGLYKNSLTIVLFLLFFFSFLLHWHGSMREYNREQVLKHLPSASAIDYLGNSRLWFESFQNWQSEFLSVLAIVILSVFLRQKGSPQSKPVDVADNETGD